MATRPISTATVSSSSPISVASNQESATRRGLPFRNSSIKGPEDFGKALESCWKNNEEAKLRKFRSTKDFWRESVVNGVTNGAQSNIAGDCNSPIRLEDAGEELDSLEIPKTPRLTAGDRAPPNTPYTVDARQDTNSLPLTPVRKEFRGKRKADGLNEFCELPAYTPYPCNIGNPADICMDDFLRSQTFECICAQAFQLATVLPVGPPPKGFISFSQTPMHQWYASLLQEFVESFERLLQERNKFPKCPEIDRSCTYLTDEPCIKNVLKLVDDDEAFDREAKMHCNAILASFHFDWPKRSLGNQEILHIDGGLPNANIAHLALKEVTSYSEFAPNKGWKIGEKLHPEFKRRLRSFDSGVVRIISERPSDSWVLDLPELLARGTAGYKEYLIAQLRREHLLGKRVEQLSYVPLSIVKGTEILEYDDVFM